MAFANHDERRLVKITDGRAFAHELRVGDDVKVTALALSGSRLDLGDDHALNAARQHRAADNDCVHGILVA